MSPKRAKTTPQILLFGAALLLFAFSANASSVCDADPAVKQAKERVEEATKKKEAAAAGSSDRTLAEREISDRTTEFSRIKSACEKDEYVKINRLSEERRCNEKEADYKKNNPKAEKPLYTWRENKCVNLSEGKAITGSDECNNADVFTDLKGKNCKKALDTVKNVQSRNSAISAAGTGMATLYGQGQVSQATGAQDDAQARQANMMKMLMATKLITGMGQLAGAAQLKAAASGAEEANSTITGAQKNLAQACATSTDEQACFYQNAQKFGLSPDSVAYANFDRMKRGAAQSHEQAEAANALAKQSMITGAADMAAAAQAYQAMKMAQQNAAQMAPPPMIGIPPPPGVVRFGQSGPVGQPGLAPGIAPGPVDYGNPSDGGTFGAANKGRIESGWGNNKMGNPNIFKSASSGVSGGGGGASASGGGGGRGGNGKGGGRRGPYNTASGEVKFGGPKAFGGGGEKDAGAAANPFADVLAKLFPQDQNGKTVVDARQIASGGEALVEDVPNNEVTSSDLTLFEQITAKYRQLDGSGKF